MASIVKRLASGVLALWFTIFTVVFPVTAHAVTYNAASNFTGRSWAVPFVGTGIAGTPIAAAAATVLTRASPWITGITIGTALVQTVIEMRNGGTIGIVAGNQLTTPIPGWGNSDTPPAVVASTGSTTTPTVTGYYVEYKSDTSVTAVGATHVEACAALWAKVGDAIKQLYGATAVDTSISTASCRYTVGTSTRSFSLTGPNRTDYCPIGTLQGTQCVIGSCPSGYAMTNGQCTLTDTPLVQWPSDGQPTYVPRVGDNGVYQWWPSDRDPDQGTYPQANINSALQSGDVFSDPDGNPVTQSFTPNSDGGYTFTQSIQHSPAGSGNTYTTTNSYTVNKQGNVTNISTVTHNGPITNVNSGSGPVQMLPTDYNREATQAAIKESINKLATGEGAQDAPDFKKDVEDKKTAMDKGITDFTDAIPGQFSETKGNWFSWVWSPPVGQCSPYSGSVHGKSITWNICPYIATARDVIGWLFALYGAWSVYNQMFRKED
jgi:viroplasmin and RNaseH domain-containing protein